MNEDQREMHDRIEVLEEALSQIEDLTNGYGDVALIVNRIAARALRPATADPFPEEKD